MGQRTIMKIDRPVNTNRAGPSHRTMASDTWS